MTWVLVLQLKAGQIFNIEAGKKALRNINSLALFSNIEVNPRPDEENDGGIVVEVKLKELEQRTAEVSTEWSIVPGSGGRPTLVSFFIDIKGNILLQLICTSTIVDFPSAHHSSLVYWSFAVNNSTGWECHF
jgi:hypothetical protein